MRKHWYCWTMLAWLIVQQVHFREILIVRSRATHVDTLAWGPRGGGTKGSFGWPCVQALACLHHNSDDHGGAGCRSWSSRRAGRWLGDGSWVPHLHSACGGILFGELFVGAWLRGLKMLSAEPPFLGWAVLTCNNRRRGSRTSGEWASPPLRNTCRAVLTKAGSCIKRCGGAKGFYRVSQ